MKTTRSPGANSGLPSSRLRITACQPLMRARQRRSALGWGSTASISTTLAMTDDMGRPLFRMPSGRLLEHRAHLARAHGVLGESKGAVLAHLPGGAQKGAERDPRERAA